MNYSPAELRDLRPNTIRARDLRATRARRFLAERLRERVAQQFDTSGSFLKRAMYYKRCITSGVLQAMYCS